MIINKLNLIIPQKNILMGQRWVWKKSGMMINRGKQNNSVEKLLMGQWWT
jgi:hypothetical protein